LPVKHNAHERVHSAEEIAVELGVAVSTVRNWEQFVTAPRMTAKGFARLMKVYGCTFDELVHAESEVRANTSKLQSDGLINLGINQDGEP
jgi:transcriptional regulator with XRE-family HTH domain